MIFLFGIIFLTPVLSSAQSYPTKSIIFWLGSLPVEPWISPTRVLASKAEKFLGSRFSSQIMEEVEDRLPLASLLKRDQMVITWQGCTSTVSSGFRNSAPVPYKLEDFVPIMHFGALNGVLW